MERQQFAEYDEEADALYVTLSSSDVEETVELDDLRLVDYGDGHSVVGVEFLSASSGIDLTDVPLADLIEQVIEASGYSFKLVA